MPVNEIARQGGLLSVTMWPCPLVRPKPCAVFTLGHADLCRFLHGVIERELTSNRNGKGQWSCSLPFVSARRYRYGHWLASDSKHVACLATPMSSDVVRCIVWLNTWTEWQGSLNHDITFPDPIRNDISNIQIQSLLSRAEVMMLSRPARWAFTVTPP